MMPSRGASPASNTDLVHEAVDWLVRAAPSMQVAEKWQAGPRGDGTPVGMRAALNNRLEGVTGHRPLPERTAPHVQSIDRQVARRDAEQLFEAALARAAPALADEATLAVEFCKSLGRPAAGPLAHACVLGNMDLVRDVRMEQHAIVAIIGVASAAAILALVVVARRQGRATFQGRSLSASKDFESLRRASLRDDRAGQIAARFLSGVREPWSFRFTSERGRPEGEPAPSDLRLLFSALAEDGESGVRAIVPAPGDRFDTKTMQARVPTDSDSVWLVAEPLEPLEFGFSGHRGEVVVRAMTTTCTADWWALTHASTECPVTRAIRGDPERYTGLEPALAPMWTAPQGLRTLADLRRVFDEATLASWAARLLRDLNPAYDGRLGRQLRLLAPAGEPYDASTMKTLGTFPLAHANVVAVGEREGIPQRGLGCPGGTPLLYAIVLVEES